VVGLRGPFGEASDSKFSFKETRGSMAEVKRDRDEEQARF